MSHFHEMPTALPHLLLQPDHLLVLDKESIARREPRNDMWQKGGEMFSRQVLLCNVGLQRNLWCRLYPITSVHALLSWAIKCPIALSVIPTDTLISICSWWSHRMKLHLVQAWLNHAARTSTTSLCLFAMPSNKVTSEWCPGKAHWYQVQQTICSATWIIVYANIPKFFSSVTQTVNTETSS